MTDRYESVGPSKLLSPDEASQKLGVSARTLQRYEVRGWITAQRTPGGHRRYVEADVDHLRVNGPPESGGAPSPRPGSDAPAVADAG